MQPCLINTKQPQLFEQWSGLNGVKRIDAATMVRAAQPPANAEFSLARDDSIRTWLAEDVQTTMLMFQQWQKRGWKPSVFVMNAQDHTPDLVQISQHQIKPAPWRTLRIGLSYSVEGSCFPAHADDADVLIIQSQGKRHWRLWEPGALVDRRALIVEQSSRFIDEALIKATPCCMEVTLEPGDALFIPAYYPHAAHSLATSDLLGNKVVSSASLVYQIISPYALLAIAGASAATLAEVAQADDDRWFAPLPDPAPGLAPLDWYLSLIGTDMMHLHGAELNQGIRTLTAI